MNQWSDLLYIWYLGSLGQGLQSLRMKKKIGAKTAPLGGAKKGQKLNFDQFQPNLVESIP